MTKVAVLDRSVRLIVIQFLIRANLAPVIIPLRRIKPKPPVLPDVSGREVLPSTKDVYLLNLLDGVRPINGGGDYELVNAWKELRTDGRFAVRYVFCRNEFVRMGELNPDFVSKRDELIDSLSNLADENLWTTQAHLNPYFDNGELRVIDKVLMFGSTSRKTTMDSAGFRRLKVHPDGKDSLGQGVGPKVSITDIAPKLQVIDGTVVLA